MKQRNTLGWGIVLLGLCFFFEPSFAGIDAFPDFIGALLIAFGLTRVAMFSRAMREVRTAFFKVAAVDAVKDFALIVVLGAGSPNEQPTAILTVLFGAAVVRLYFLLPAISALFVGILTLAIEADCRPLYTAVRAGRSRPELLRRFTMVFLVMREVLCLLPEFSSLTTSTYIDSAAIDLYRYIGLMRGFSAFFALIFGILWLIRVLSFFLRVRREREFAQQLYGSYFSYREAHPDAPLLRLHGVGLWLIGAGVFFLADFYLDLHNILPDWIGAALILLGISLLRLPWRVRLPAVIGAVVYGAISAISSRFSYVFEWNFTAREVQRNADAAAAYCASWLTALAEFFLFLAFFALLLLLLRRFAEKWGVFRPDGDLAFEERARVRLREEMDGQWIKCYVFAFLSGLASFFYDFLNGIAYTERYRLLEFFWFADFVLGIAFACVFAVTLSRLFEILQKRSDLS